MGRARRPGGPEATQVVSTAAAVEPSDDSQSDDTDSPATDKQMTKGVLRRLRRTMDALHTLVTVPVPVRRKVLEICTWTGNLSAEAAKRGWDVISPVTLETGYDLTTRTGRRMAMDVLEKEKPDLVVFAWPCTVWSALQNINNKTSEYAEKLQERRKRPL